MENKEKIINLLLNIKKALEVTKEKFLIAKELIIKFQEKYQSTDMFKDVKDDLDVVQLGEEIEELADEISFYN
jgi:hypothetical protein|nr:MAG TPA: hypothetical protein [Caudoviricetes sp.]